MACVNPDGTVTKPGRAMLAAMKEPVALEEVAKVTGIPIYRIRSVIRELLEADLASEDQGKYSITRLGLDKI